MTGLVRLECVKCKCVFEALNPPMDFIEYAICPTCQQHLGDDSCARCGSSNPDECGCDPDQARLYGELS